MMADAIRQAQGMHRKAMEGTYDGTCRAYGMGAVKDPVTKVTRQEEVMLLDGIPCHLSYTGTGAAAASGTVTAVPQTARLFLGPGLEVPPGSRIEVTQQGRTGSYAKSGKASVYASHQEIPLELWEGYA